MHVLQPRRRPPSFTFTDVDDDDDSLSSTQPTMVEGGPLAINLGTYSCQFVSNIPPNSNNNDPSNPRTYFDFGLRHFFAYQHEDAYKHFLACLTLAPDCAFAHGMVVCHDLNERSSVIVICSILLSSLGTHYISL